MDHHPDLPGVEDAVRRSLVRICPICDGYEATGKTVAVIGDSDMGVREAAFIRTYSDKVTLIHVGRPEALTERDALDRLGVSLVETSIEQVHLEEDRVTALTFGGRRMAFDFLYSALGASPNGPWPKALALRPATTGGWWSIPSADHHSRPLCRR